MGESHTNQGTQPIAEGENFISSSYSVSWFLISRNDSDARVMPSCITGDASDADREKMD